MRAFVRAVNRVVIPGLALLLAGCRSTTPVPATTAATGPKTLPGAMAQSAALGQPLAVLVVELGQTRADAAALSWFGSAAAKHRPGGLVTYVLDLAISRNRATAARFHPVQTPLLVCLSPKGVIISRDERPLNKKLILRRMDQASVNGTKLDAQLVALQHAAETNSNRSAALLGLARFLMAHHNALEAVPVLAAVAHCETCADARRVEAWVALARAHMWVGEPEKARAEARNLLASLGAHLPEARAGAKLLLGIDDANLHRPAVARQEFEEAMAQAPGTIYAKEAAEMLVELRKRWTLK